MHEYDDEFADQEPEGALVRWMDRPPMSVGAGALSGAVAGAFLLGAAAALGLVLLSGRFTPPSRPRNLFSRSIH